MVGYRYNQQKRRIDVFEDCRLYSYDLKDSGYPVFLIPNDAKVSDYDKKIFKYGVQRPNYRCWRCDRNEGVVYLHRTVWLSERNDREAAEILCSDFESQYRKEMRKVQEKFWRMKGVCQKFHGGIMRHDIL